MRRIRIFLLCTLLFLTMLPVSAGAETMATITAEIVNFRKGPSAIDAVIMELPMGTRVTVLRKGTSWHMVSYNGQQGYISAAGMQIDGEAPTPPAKIYGVTKQAASLLDKPSGSSTGKRVDANATLELVHYENGWFRVKAKSDSGYVRASVMTDYDINPPEGAKYAATSLKKQSLYSEPSTKSTAMLTIPVGASVDVTKVLDEFAYIAYSDTQGYVPVKNLRIYFAPRTSQIDELSTQVDYADNKKGRIVNTKVQNFSYAMLNSAIAKLKKRFPKYITVSTLGKSTAGREIPLLLLGNPDAPKRIWVDTSMHAREHMCTQIVMNQVEFLLNNYEKGVFEGKRLRDSLDEVCLYIIPMGNPDGVELVQRGLDSVSDPATREYLLGLNNGSTDFSRWKANIRGVDLVSNFDAKWAEKATTSDSPAPYGYKGEKPFSEVETQLCADMITRGQFSMTISYHAVGGELYWWFGQDGARQDRDFNVAMGFADLTGYTLISKERSLTDSAGLKDWAIMTFQQPGITVELGPTTSIAPVPIGDYEQIWERNRFVLWHAANLFA